MSNRVEGLWIVERTDLAQVGEYWRVIVRAASEAEAVHLVCYPKGGKPALYGFEASGANATARPLYTDGGAVVIAGERVARGDGR